MASVTLEAACTLSFSAYMNVFEQTRQKRLCRELSLAINQYNWPQVEKLLIEGASPNGHGENDERHPPLVRAVIHKGAPLSILEAFLKAGATVTPYKFLNEQHALSEVATLWECTDEIVARLRTAQAESQLNMAR